MVRPPSRGLRSAVPWRHRNAAALSPLGALDVSRQQLARQIIFRSVRHRPCWARQSRPVEPWRTRHTACRAPTRPCTRLVDHTASRACWRRCPATAVTLARPPAKRCKVAVLPQRPTRAAFRGPATSAIRLCTTRTPTSPSSSCSSTTATRSSSTVRTPAPTPSAKRRAACAAPADHQAADPRRRLQGIKYRVWPTIASGHGDGVCRDDRRPAACDHPVLSGSFERERWVRTRIQSRKAAAPGPDATQPGCEPRAPRQASPCATRGSVRGQGAWIGMRLSFSVVERDRDERVLR
jgi:hypothetical protein